MHKVALFNGKIVETDEALIPALSAAAMYGRGVFTTIAVYDGEPFLIDKHWRRLADNTDKVDIDLKVSFEQIEIWLRQLLKTNREADCRARVTLFDSAGSSLWTGTPASGTDVLIVTGEIRDVPTEFKLDISELPINSGSPLAGVKSCNYLEHVTAYEAAKWRGFDEAIRLNERGEVASAIMSNIFWLSNGQLFTPSLETGCLAGTTREFILENLDVREVCVRSDELKYADAVFVSSAGVGVTWVASINDKQFDPTDHAILHLLPNTKTRMSAR